MEDCLPDTEYAAVKATNLLNDETYNAIKNFLIAADCHPKRPSVPCSAVSV